MSKTAAAMAIPIPTRAPYDSPLQRRGRPVSQYDVSSEALSDGIKGRIEIIWYSQDKGERGTTGQQHSPKLS